MSSNPNPVLSRGYELEREGYVFNLYVSRECGCGDVFIHPEGTVVQLSPTSAGNRVDEQKWDSLAEYQE